MYKTHYTCLGSVGKRRKLQTRLYVRIVGTLFIMYITYGWTGDLIVQAGSSAECDSRKLKWLKAKMFLYVLSCKGWGNPVCVHDVDHLKISIPYYCCLSSFGGARIRLGPKAEPKEAGRQRMRREIRTSSWCRDWRTSGNPDVFSITL